MPQEIQNPSVQYFLRFQKAANTIGALRFLWRRSRLLSRELKRARSHSAPRVVLDAYDANRSVIEAIYGKNHVRHGLLYHGTGALQYDGDKYGTGMNGRLRRPLDTILKNGLSPHTDPWALTEGSPQSISFATVWAYARFYAEAHQTSDDPLNWEYGNRVGWFSYCIVGTAWRAFGTAVLAGRARISGRPGQELKTLRQTRERTGSGVSYSPLQCWALDIRKGITLQTSPIDIICGRTDIPGNFGAIITVSENDVPLKPMRLGGTYEKRAARSIRPDEFTSLAVPLSKVDEYTAKVHKLGYSFPVLPIEAVEYRMSHFPLQELTYAQRVV